MKKILTIAVGIMATSTLCGQSIKDLDFLVGTWDVSEVVYPGSDREYVETGKRVCGYYLGDSYIKCETNGIRKGKERSYTFLFNYEKSEDRFRLIKLHSDGESYSIKSWKINVDLQVVFEEDITGEQFISDISFEDRNKLIWRGWSPKNGRNPELQLIFIETATRQ